jgi:hypothetical protein
MTAFVGERAVSRYIKHPAASTTGILSNGWPIDSGTVITTLENNTHHLQHESLRPLVWSSGSGNTPIFNSAAQMFAGLPEFTVAPPGATFGTHRAIPWDRKTSARFPVFLIADQNIDTGEATLRWITMTMRLTVAANVTSGRAHFALTFSSAPPFQNEPFLHSSAAVTSNALNTVSVTLQPDTPIDLQSMGTITKCRHASTNGTSAQAVVLLGHLWFGWSLGGASVVAASRIESFAAWEVWA